MVVFNQQTTINTKNSLDAGTGSDHKDFGVVAGIEFNKDGTKMFTSFANQACVMEKPLIVLQLRLHFEPQL